MKPDPQMRSALDHPVEWVQQERAHNKSLSDEQILSRYCDMSEVGRCLMAMQALSLRALYEDRPDLLKQIPDRAGLDRAMVEDGISLSRTLIEGQIRREQARPGKLSGDISQALRRKH